MAAKTARDLTSEVAYLTRALKAPTLRDSVDRLAERARAESWSIWSSWSPACNERSPPVNPTAVRAASGPHGSLPARAWKSSTSIMPAASNAT